MENQKKIFAFDLDGTLTEPRTWITDEHLAMLDGIRRRGIRVVIVGAGRVSRIFTQMREYAIDIIGNYGLQYGRYREEHGVMEMVRDLELPCDRNRVEKTILDLRRKLGYEAYAGEGVEFHPTGVVTFPMLGTHALISDKIAFDPDHSVRCALYADVAAAFPDYSVFIGGTTSFDLVPKPYDKYYALDVLCREEGYSHGDVLYFGDDFEQGGNDSVVADSDMDFVPVRHCSELPELVRGQLED